MQSVGWYVRRVRSMGPGEILWRVRSVIRDYTDVLRFRLRLVPHLIPGTIPPPKQFSPGFRFDLHPDSTSLLVPGKTEWVSRLKNKANGILENRLSYFDLDDQYLGDPVDWHADQSANKAGPMRHRTFVDYRDFSAFGDCKLVWEPNRHHQLVVLARCFRVTGDARYAEKVCQIICDWRAANPFGYGMNWKSPMEVAIRNINWIFAIDLLLQSDVLEKGLFRDAVETIFLGTWDTVRRLSRGSSANNHLIGEAAGIYIACAYFRDFPGRENWQRLAKSILEEELDRQTYSDGCTREHAFGYMFFVIQFLQLAMIAGSRSGDEFSPAYRQRLHAMYAFLAEVSSDSGRPPDIGDADDGYVVDLGELPRDAAELISVGADIFGDERLRLATDCETIFWLTGKKSAVAGRSPIRRAGSVAFEESGYYLLRTGNHRGNEISVFFDCANLGFGAIAAHGHADCLSFVLTVGGKRFFVDGGTFDYFSYPDWREYFRSSLAHNSVTIDGLSQSVATGPFMWSSGANAKLLKWQDDDARTIVCGEHDGYLRLHEPAVHRRMLTLDKQSLAVEVIDSIKSAGSHSIVRHLHLAANCAVERVSGSAIRVTADDTSILAESDDAYIEIVPASDDGFIGWVSDGYHRRSPSRTLRLVNRSSGDIELRLNVRVLP